MQSFVATTKRFKFCCTLAPIQTWHNVTIRHVHLFGMHKRTSVFKQLPACYERTERTYKNCPNSSSKCNTHEVQAMSVRTLFHYAPQPDWWFNADADMAHAFGIFMAHVGTLRTTCSGAG